MKIKNDCHAPSSILSFVFDVNYYPQNQEWSRIERELSQSGPAEFPHILAVPSGQFHQNSILHSFFSPVKNRYWYRPFTYLPPFSHFFSPPPPPSIESMSCVTMTMSGHGEFPQRFGGALPSISSHFDFHCQFFISNSLIFIANLCRSLPSKALPQAHLSESHWLCDHGGTLR